MNEDFFERHKTVPEKNPHSPNTIYRAWGALPESGVFPYLSVTNTPATVSWVISNRANLQFQNIPLAGSLTEFFRVLERFATRNVWRKWEFLLKLMAKAIKLRWHTRGKPVHAGNSPDILVVVEYCTQPHDLHYLETLERAKGDLTVEYWVSSPKVKDDIRNTLKKGQIAIGNKLLAAEKTIIEISSAEKGPPFSTSIFKSNQHLAKSLGKCICDAWWSYYSSFAFSLANGIDILLERRKPRMLLLTDDTKICGSIAAKISRKHGIPSVLVPHVGPGTFYLPLLCDYEAVLGKRWVDLLLKCGLNRDRIWVVGDLAGRPTQSVKEKNQDLREKIGIVGKNIVGYFASFSEPHEPGLWAMIEVCKQMPNTVVLVRPHPRHPKYADYLSGRLKTSSAILLRNEDMDLEAFCSVTDVVATFESSTLLYGVRYGNYGLQVKIFKEREPENDFAQLLHAPVAHDKKEIKAVLEEYFDKDKQKKHLLEREGALKDLYHSFGEDAGNRLFGFMKNEFVKKPGCLKR